MGLSFLASGALISFLSSWYIILIGRIASFLFNGQQLSAYDLSLLSSVGGNPEVGSKLVMDLLGVLIVVWGLSVFDAIGSVFATKRAAEASSLQEQSVSGTVPFSQGGPVRSVSHESIPPTSQATN